MALPEEARWPFSWIWKDKEQCPGGLEDTEAEGIAWHRGTLSGALGLWTSPALESGGSHRRQWEGSHAGTKCNFTLTHCSFDSWNGARGKESFTQLLDEVLTPCDRLSKWAPFVLTQENADLWAGLSLPSGSQPQLRTAPSLVPQAFLGLLLTPSCSHGLPQISIRPGSEMEQKHKA